METLTKVTIPTVVLQELVSKAVKGSTMVDVIPLSCLMQIKINNNKLTIRTTDNVNYVTLSASVEAPDFEVVVESKLFANLVCRLSTKETSLSVEDNKLMVSANGKYNIPVVTEPDGNKINFPDVTFEPTGSTVHVTYEELRSVLTQNKACKAIMKDVPCLFNYYFDEYNALTTDAYRACINNIKLSDRPTVVSPVLMELALVIADVNYGIDISQDDSNIMFTTQNQQTGTDGVIIGKKNSSADLEKFPVEDLVEISKAKFEHITKLNKTLFVQAVERMGLFTDAMEENKLEMTFSKSGVSLYAPKNESREDIKFIEELPVDIEPCTISISGNDLKTEIAACSSEELLVGFNEEIGICIKCGKADMIIAILG